MQLIYRIFCEAVYNRIYEAVLSPNALLQSLYCQFYIAKSNSLIGISMSVSQMNLWIQIQWHETKIAHHKKRLENATSYSWRYCAFSTENPTRCHTFCSAKKIPRAFYYRNLGKIIDRTERKNLKKKSMICWYFS